MDVVGAVTNVTDFGAFVDVGVERDVLIHRSEIKDAMLNVGQRVAGTIIKLDIPRQRINMSLREILYL